MVLQVLLRDGVLRLSEVTQYRTISGACSR